MTLPHKRSAAGLEDTIKFVVRDNKEVLHLLRDLCYRNDTLNKSISDLEQASQRRRLRVRFSTGDIDQLQELQAAAAFLHHRDLEEMASVRTVIEKCYWKEKSPTSYPKAAPATSDAITPSTDFRLEMGQLEWQGQPTLAYHPPALATYKGDSIIVYWRPYQDDSWGYQNTEAFRERIESLTRVLNSNLKALDIGVLRSLGYFDQSSNIIGFAFKVPSNVTSGQKPTTLHQLFHALLKGLDIFNVGPLFEIAKALVSTVFEILNLGLLHKSIREYIA